MAEVLNECTARSKGEQRLAQLLKSFEDPAILLAFTVDFIPGCREIDLLLTHEQLGIFVIEIKAIPLGALLSVSPNEWAIEGRANTESPLRQAYAQYEGLRSHWDARMRSKLFSAAVCATACLPEMTRNEWLRAFPRESYASSIAEGMIFREDLIDSECLIERLAIAMKSPPIRKGREPRALNRAVLDDLRSLFLARIPQVPTLTDRARLQAIEKQITKELLRDFPADGGAFAYYTGQPGTGKTFRLLSVGSAHAYSGKKVLFACFNKTLAADVRRLLSFNEKLSLANYQLDVADVFQLAKRSFEMNGLSQSQTDSADEWGKLVVEELKKRPESAILDQYDTVLIDEAHDLQDWQLELLALHAKAGATICIAVGKGQELYRDDSSATKWLETMAQGGKVRQYALRRNFRNTRAQYFAALAFHQAWPDNLAKVAVVHKDVFSRIKKTDDLLDFGRDGEALTYIPLPALPGEFEDSSQDQTMILAVEYGAIIQEEIEAQKKSEGFPVGLLVLVPSETCQQAIIARRALSQLVDEMEGVSFIDYTKEDNRRSVASNNDVRLCTFHSSRGLEGERVIIFGLENIEALATKTNVKAENLAFIALSRALFRTVLVVRTYYTNRVHPLMKAIVQTGSNGAQ